MIAFVKSNYFHIAKEVYKKTQEYNVPKKELFVDIDFFEDAPALRNEFKVRLTSDFLDEGSSVADAPAWFQMDEDKKAIAMCMMEHYERLTSDHLLVVYRNANRLVTVQALRLGTALALAPWVDENILGGKNKGEETQKLLVHNEGYELLSDEAVKSIGREDYVRMVACLGGGFTNRYFEKKSGLVLEE
jgi:hypothetical protein